MAARKIKTADEHVQDVVELERKLRKEQTEFERLQERAERSEYLRDELCSIILNSRVSPEVIRARGGVTPQTLRKYMEKTSRHPLVHKMNATGRAVGVELGWKVIGSSND